MPTARSTFRSNLQYALGNRDDAGNARLDAWLNEAVLSLASKLRIRNLETSTTATLSTVVNTLALPAAILVPLQLRNDTANLPMERIDWTEYRQLRVGSRRPTQWTLWGTTFYFDATATAADTISIFGIARPSWAAGDAATPGVDDEYEYGIHLLAQTHAWRDLGAPDKAALIDNPQSPGVGTFWTWARANKFPPLLAGTAPRRSVVAPDLAGYDGLGG